MARNDGNREYKRIVRIRQCNARMIDDDVVELELLDCVPIDSQVLRELLEQQYHLSLSQGEEVFRLVDEMAITNLIRERTIRD